MAKAKSEKPKAKKITEGKTPGARTPRVYRINPKLAKEAEKLTAPQTAAIYGVLAHAKDGLTAKQIEEKVLKLGFKSKNPPSVVAACLYDLRHGVCSAKAAGVSLVEIVEQPKGASAEKKSTKPKAKGTQPAPAPTPAA
jgi:hypothetical protein